MHEKNYIFSDEFDNNEDGTVVYEFTNAVNQSIKIMKIGDTFEFTTNYLACPRIAYAYYNDKFIFDLGRIAISDFVKEYYPNDYKKENIEAHFKGFKISIKEDYEINHINFIENWKKVIICKDGTFKKEDYPLIPYSIELKDAYDLVHQLLLKYKNVISDLFKKGKFIPTITGGLDTRVLTALWKDNLNDYKLDCFYLKNIKNDGKNNVELSKADLECAMKVASRFNLFKNIEHLKDKVTLSGIYTDNICSLYKVYFNDSDFIYKFIQHGNWWGYNLRPYADDLYLQIKHPGKYVFRCLLAMILTPDLLDIPLIGSNKIFINHNHQPYNFYEEYKDYIPLAQEIIDYWGEEKCKNILKVSDES